MDMGNMWGLLALTGGMGGLGGMGGGAGGGLFSNPFMMLNLFNNIRPRICFCGDTHVDLENSQTASIESAFPLKTINRPTTNQGNIQVYSHIETPQAEDTLKELHLIPHAPWRYNITYTLKTFPILHQGAERPYHTSPPNDSLP
ncbi:hypothetical protein ElyMa_001160700 [Elysia marginata]|uniref:Calcineurin-like phosphoesterase domain-containing protein n=1 Tax=Elysia marginata TaxID=1093978 RepID=A0AAV4I5D2_9GAST|nr:hypothetical protein ElyMa_001160700 [Elysia marginata]